MTHAAGLLGQGSILTVTSYPNRTSPVLRGHWLLDNILGAPPPPPPPDVPALPESGEGGKPASVRERLEQHRKNPVCATCHAPMDPLGFALENFDAIGKWRTIERGRRPIDASGAFPDGTKFRGSGGPEGDPAEPARAVCRNRHRKALDVRARPRSRVLRHAGGPQVIVRQAVDDDYRWSSIILGIVNSTPFQMRRSES